MNRIGMSSILSVIITISIDTYNRCVNSQFLASLFTLTGETFSVTPPPGVRNQACLTLMISLVMVNIIVEMLTIYVDQNLQVLS